MSYGSKATLQLIHQISTKIRSFEGAMVPLLPCNLAILSNNFLFPDLNGINLSDQNSPDKTDLNARLKTNQSLSSLTSTNSSKIHTSPSNSISLDTFRLHDLKVKVAAVLIPICQRVGEASVLFTIRSLTVGTHKGQVSFPGGHLEIGESAKEAALRETREELGNEIGEVEVLGYCQPIRAITGTIVIPVIGVLRNDLKDFSQLTLSTVEVTQVFCLSLKHLMDPTNKRVAVETRLGSLVPMPTFLGGPQPIWGLTALILAGLLDNVITPALFSKF